MILKNVLIEIIFVVGLGWQSNELPDVMSVEHEIDLHEQENK
jgi:hypothetical protein